ncbi:MAG: glutamate 5-kinase [Selenomonas sp.]|nr:glutamate 5-kinase [Selenomonas sp.]
MTARERLKEAKRIVVKVGTSSLTHATGRLSYENIERLVRQIADLQNAGKEMILVTSGAMAAGLGRMNMTEKPAELPRKQALAAVGQGVLMHIYERFFAEYGQTAAQVLLTRENSLRHSQYTHSRNALLALIQMGVIPVINENDAVAVEEFKIGDNDTLSAVVAALVDADALIILSDIEGVYTANPNTNPEAKLMSEIKEITPEIEALAGGAGTKLGTGGMMTKIEAAKIAGGAGITLVIAPGARRQVLREVLAGEQIGTVFPAKEEHLRVRKGWLAFGKRLSGDITVDKGCEVALSRGSSLLAAGVTSCEGDFEAGSSVRVLSADGREIARGQVSYGSEILRKLAGHRSEDFKALLTDTDIKDLPEEVIHRDNLVLMV